MSNRDVCAMLDISPQRWSFLVKKYDLPYYVTGGGKIFLKEDIEAFQESR